MQTFWDWFFGEPGAAWIIGSATLLAALVGAFYAWRRRERPPRVIIQEIERSRLLAIHHSQRDRLSVFYTDDDGTRTPIEDLEQKEIVIYNMGTKDISDGLELALRFYRPDSGGEEFQGFWRWIFEDPRCKWSPITTNDPRVVSALTGDEKQIVGHGVRIHIPYLNSYPIHRHYVKSYLVSDREVEFALSERMGKGWSAHMAPLYRSRKIEENVGEIGFAILMGLSVLPVPVMLLIGLMGFAKLAGANLAVASAVLILGFVAPIVWIYLLARRIPQPTKRFENMLGEIWLGARMPSEFKRKGR